MTVSYLPFTFDKVDLANDSRIFWKRLLPLDGELNYKGTQIKFTKDMLNKMVNAFKDKAYPQVAFQFANDNNEHPSEEPKHMSPEKYRGQITGLKVTKDGLVGRFDLTEEGAKLVRDNKNLGVSVSYRQDYRPDDRPDKKYPYALRHVVGTIDPKVTGLGTWSQVELSNAEENEEVEDLTGGSITTDSKPNTDDKNDKTGNDETVSVKKSEWDAVISYVKSMQEAEQDLGDLMASDDSNASKDDKSKVDASNTSKQLVELSNEVAGAKFDREADSLIRQGVPPSMVTEARKILGVSNIVSLSNDGGESDPRVVIRKILEEAKGTVDLSEAIGHSQSDDSDKEREEKKAEFERVRNFMVEGI